MPTLPPTYDDLRAALTNETVRCEQLSERMKAMDHELVATRTRATAAEQELDGLREELSTVYRVHGETQVQLHAAESALAEARGALRELRTTARNVLLALVEEDDGLIHDGPEKGEARCEPYAVCILCGEDMLADGGHHDPLRPCGPLAAAVPVGGDHP